MSNYIKDSEERGAKKGQTSSHNEDDDAEAQTAEDHVRVLSALLPPLRCVGSDWYCYQDGLWLPTTPDLYRPTALDLLHGNKHLDKFAQMLLRTVEGRHQVDRSALCGVYRFAEDGKSVLINARNGVIHVAADSVTLLDHSAEYGFTCQLAGAYILDAPCAVFPRVLGEALPDDDDKDLLYWMGGYTLLPDCRHRVALVCVGPTGTGKTVLLGSGLGSVFSAHPVAIGRNREPLPQEETDRCLTALDLRDICDSKGYSLPRLRWAALNLGGELSDSELTDSAKFKALVGGEGVEARPIYGKPFKMRSTCKLVFLSNHLPTFRCGTSAELDRLRFLSFSRTPAVRDETLGAAIEAERDGILSHILVPALQDVLSGSTPPLGGQQSRALRDRFAVVNDPFDRFIHDCLVFGPDLCVRKEDLEGAYRAFAETAIVAPQTRKALMRVLLERFPGKLEDYRPREGRDRKRRVRGVGLKPGVDITLAPPLGDEADER